MQQNNLKRISTLVNIINLMDSQTIAIQKMVDTIVNANVEQIICFHLHTEMICTTPDEKNAYETYLATNSQAPQQTLLMIPNAGMMDARALREFINSQTQQPEPEEPGGALKNTGKFKLDTKISCAALQAMVAGFQAKRAECIAELEKYGFTIPKTSNNIIEQPTEIE